MAKIEVKHSEFEIPFEDPAIFHCFRHKLLGLQLCNHSLESSELNTTDRLCKNPICLVGSLLLSLFALKRLFFCFIKCRFMQCFGHVLHMGTTSDYLTYSDTYVCKMKSIMRVITSLTWMQVTYLHGNGQTHSVKMSFWNMEYC